MKRMNLSNVEIIALDVDEVLADNINEIIRWHNRVYGSNLRREDFHSYRFWEVWGGTRDDAIRKYYAFMRERGSKIPLVENALDSVRILSTRYKLVGVTSRQHDFRDLTEEWVKKNFGSSISRVYLTNSYDMNGKTETRKSDVLTEISADLLVDDQIRHAQDSAEKGINVFLYDAPWNQSLSNSGMIKRVFSWKEIVAKLTSS